MGNQPLTLVWLRRDLRLHDHRGFAKACALDGMLQPVFLFDREILARFHRKDDPRLTFVAETLQDLHQRLRKRGAGLLVLYGNGASTMQALCSALQSAHLVAAADAEPATRARDEAVRKRIEGFCQVHLIEDCHGLFATRVLKPDGTPYTVYTPYSKKWRKTMGSADIAEAVFKDKGRYADFAGIRKKALAADLAVLDADNVEAMLEVIGYRRAKTAPWKANEGEVRLKRFLQHHLGGYAHGRNYPAEASTSELSPFLRFGQISVRQCLRTALDHHAERWLLELIWRDFYASVLYHFPQVVEHEFKERFRGTLRWSSHSAEHLQAWQQGRTGYPYIDAAMRQLTQTSWMHNRARLAVASFLTKDLQVDWRAGEEHFAQFLMDYDLASNNGNWQWCASTGTDAQPWFRIFNPVTQSVKFDPHGEYIRQFVPEVAHLSDKEIHMPWKGKQPPKDYPPPIVDHDEARQKTLAMFKRLV